MKKIFIFCIVSILGSVTILHSQERYAKIIDFDKKPQNASEIIKYENNYYVNITGVCLDLDGYLTEACSGIIKIDENLSILDSIIINNFSIGIKSLLIDTITEQFFYSGEDYFKNKIAQEYKVYKYNINKLEKSETISLQNKEQYNRKYFQITGEVTDNYIFVGGTFNELDDKQTESLLFFLRPNNSDTSIIVNFAQSTYLWNSLIDTKNQLNLALMSSMIGGFRQAHILKFDENLNQIWHWTSENIDYIQKPYICELNDGRIVITVSDPVAPKIASLEAINPDKSRSWKYRFPDISGKIQRRVYRIKTLQNGDIIGMGGYGNSNLNLDTKITEVPYVFRMSPSGQLLWEKAFYRTRPVVDYCLGSLHDVIELENGDLLAVGRIDNYLEYDPVVFQGRPDPDILIIRMDANGCIDSECKTITKIETTTVSTIDHDHFGSETFLFPNPGSQEMELFNHDLVGALHIYDIQGKLVHTLPEPQHTLDISKLPSGLYIVHIVLNNNKSIRQKIMVK
ncbi:MAG: T9SS type A sorting domain-containing protein [Saprospiraceae bacterium]|nr:T9SS type A sorting domain-containing protein [Saprospiraceae bacterium]